VGQQYSRRNLIDLKPGFHALSGSNFTALYGGVTNVDSCYHYLKNHLGSIKMTLNSSGGVVGYNDYYPFGMTMTGRSQVPFTEDSRYKFTGKERDASTGLDYFACPPKSGRRRRGARYYDSWRGRWGQVDPLYNLYPNLSPFNYAKDNPIGNIDPNGAYSYEIDGMSVDDQMGNIMMDDYGKDYLKWDNPHGNKVKEKSNSDNNKTQAEQTKSSKNKNSVIFTLNLSGALSDPVGWNLEYGILWDASNPFFYNFYYSTGYSFGAEDSYGLGINVYYSNISDFRGIDTRSLTNNPNWQTLMVGPVNLTYNEKPFNLEGFGINPPYVNYGEGIGINFTNKTEISKPIPFFMRLLTPVFYYHLYGN